MLTFTIGFLTFPACAFVLWRIYARAPEGWEDSSGFNFGPQPLDHSGDEQANRQRDEVAGLHGSGVGQ